MDANQAQHAGPNQALCPFLQPAQAEWIYPVQGFCRGLPQGLLMIPSVEEYRTRCSTEAYTACPIYRSRTAGDRRALDAWLRMQYQNWGLRPAEGAANPRPPEDAAPAGACAGRPSTPGP
jgi:hypothetical protein